MASTVKLKANVNMSISASLVSQDVASNTSRVSIVVKLIHSTGGLFTYAGKGDGYRIRYDLSGPQNWSSTQGWRDYSWRIGNITLWSSTISISHNSDGSVSGNTFKISMYGQSGSTLAATGGHTADVSISIPDIPRASSPTLSASSANLGSQITINTNRKSTAFTHTAKYRMGSQSGTIATGIGTSQTWTLPNSLASAIPNARSGVLTIELDTYNGSKLIGTRQVNLTAKVPDTTTWQPTVPSVTISHEGNRPTGSTSYVQGRSKAKVVSSSTARGGASISSYRVTVSNTGTYYGGNVTSGWLTNSGTVTITVRATDSRGYWREKSDTITVTEYSPPKLTTYTANRGPDDQGTNLVTGINFSVSPIDNKNTKKYRIRYREVSGTWHTLVQSDGYYTRNTTHSAAGVLNPDKSYEIEFYVADWYGNVTQTRNVPTAFVLFDWNDSGRGFAIGKVSESNSFEVAMPAEFSGGINSQSVNGKDMNTVTETGFYQGYNMTNAAVQTISTFIVNKYTSDWIDQIQIKTGAPPEMYIRSKHSGTTWGAWQKQWHSRNSYVIVESGSNKNGRYVRFSDGTQICWQSTSLQGLSVANASIYASPSYAFPATFLSSPASSYQGYVTNSNGTRLGIPLVEDTASGRGLVWGFHFKNDSGTELTRVLSIMMMAIGRWK